MEPLAQYYESGAGSAFAGIFFVMLLILAAVSFIPASIASSKGYSAVAFYFFGLFFFLPALIVALFLPAKAGSTATPSAPAAPGADRGLPAPSGPGTASFAGRRAPPPGPGVVRECPYCKEPMRRDASVCPHCRRGSPAWEYRDGS
jgi:hypothetical protein